MPMIRTVFQPDTPREVDEAEAAQLERQRLLLPLETEQPAAVVPVPAAPKAPVTVPASTPATPTKEATPDGDKQAQ